MPEASGFRNVCRRESKKGSSAGPQSFPPEARQRKGEFSSLNVFDLVGDQKRLQLALAYFIAIQILY